jgi:hypothetical protein
MIGKFIAIAALCAYKANAIKLTQDDETTFDNSNDINDKIWAGEYTEEEVAQWAETHGADLTKGNMMDFIDHAAENGYGLEEVEGLIEGAAASGAFDKHDIAEFVLDTCESMQLTEESLNEFWAYAGEKLGISEEEGESLLQKAGELFDIS